MEFAVIVALVIVVLVLALSLRAALRNLRLVREGADRKAKKAVTQSRAVLGGKFTENMAPYLPEFRYDPTEARFIGGPIDFIVFPGLSSGEPTEVVIMEIKASKTGRLSHKERRIQELVEQGKVRFEVIHRPSE
jgi:predicted Holliday junction resolvase-like endonuclease